MQFGGTVAVPTIQLAEEDNPLGVVDLYSQWVDWIHADIVAHAIYPAAFPPVGGDLKTTIGADQKLVGKVVFIQPPWQILPWEGTQTLAIDGELYREGGGVPVEPTIGAYRTNVLYTVPGWSEVERVASGSGLDATQAAQLASVSERALAVYRLMGLDPVNPVVTSADGAGIMTVMVGALIGQVMTPVYDADGQLESLTISRTT